MAKMGRQPAPSSDSGSVTWLGDLSSVLPSPGTWRWGCPFCREALNEMLHAKNAWHKLSYNKWQLLLLSPCLSLMVSSA